MLDDRKLETISTRGLDPDALHQRLCAFNRRRLAPGRPGDDWRRALAEEHDMRLLEGDFVEGERDAVMQRAAEAPSDPDGFVRWFEALRDGGPGQNDPLFPWLGRHASAAQMRWFLTQEVAGEAGFDDLVAMAQVKMAERPKLELARNYWDEMGRGRAGGMHGPMLARLAAHLELPPGNDRIVWEALALGNLLVALAANRRYAYHALGALGAIELTAPTRAGHVNDALKRLAVPAAARRYFALHATLDVKHSIAWNAEVLRPLVAEDPANARALAEGALLRLRAGERCFDRYRREFGLS